MGVPRRVVRQDGQWIPHLHPLLYLPPRPCVIFPPLLFSSVRPWSHVTARTAAKHRIDFRSHSVYAYFRDHLGSFTDVEYKGGNTNRGWKVQLTKTMQKDEFGTLLSKNWFRG